MIRNNHKYWISENEFHQLLELKQIRSSDLIQSQSGQFFRADQFQELRPFLVNDLSTTFNSLLKLVAFGATSYLIVKAFEKPKTKRRKPNKETVPSWKRDYVRYRDGSYCTYCGRRVNRRTGHVDHSKSRRNGGSNHLNNLRLACIDCNLSKGSLNSNQFIRLLY